MTTEDIEALLVSTLRDFTPDGPEWTQLVLMGGFETMMVKQIAFELNAKTKGVPQQHAWTTEYGRVDLGLADLGNPIGPDNLKYKAEFKINYVRQGLTNKTTPLEVVRDCELRERLMHEINRTNEGQQNTNIVVGLMMCLVRVEKNETIAVPAVFNINAPKGVIGYGTKSKINSEEAVNSLIAGQFPVKKGWQHGDVWRTAPWGGWRGRLQFVWKSLSR